MSLTKVKNLFEYRLFAEFIPRETEGIKVTGGNCKENDTNLHGNA